MATALPLTLRTSTPAEGLDLARRLAAEAMAKLPTADSMADRLKTYAANRPAPEMVTAIYYHAISIANAGWMQGR